MKKYFYLGIAIILIMALAIVGYGAWLNYSDEHQIANRMDNRRVQLSGAQAAQRQGRLIAKNATAQEKYEESLSQYLAAQEALQEAQAQYQQCLVMENWLNVEAPLDGEVLLIYQREGTYVQAGTPVALVGDFDRLSFSMNLPDEDTRHLRVGENSVMAFPQGQDLSKVYDTDYAAGNVGWGQKVQATLKDIVPPLSEPAEIRRTVWEVDNRTRTLEPMTYTGVRMVTGQSYTCLTVPLSAMVDGNYDKVYVLDDEGRLRLRQVRTGTDDDSYIEIYEGLQEGEVVVTGNMEGLHEGMKAEISLEGGGR